MTGESVGICGIPPAGWTCTRGHGHEGPCAAHQVVNRKPKVINLSSYTEWQPAFSMAKEQREAINAWIDEHDLAKHIPPGQSFRYAGAIGGSYTWSFTPTSLGIVVTVRCACGEAIDVSDYDEW